MEKKITIKKNELFDEKEVLIKSLNKLFSFPPSIHGYKHDIEEILKELYIDEDSYFDYIIECLSKEIRKKDDLNLIASYLFFMQEFTKLLNDKETAKEETQKQTQLLNELLNLSSSIYYLKMPKDIILMRYGEKGNKAYINLNGVVDILIKSSKSIKTSEKDFLNYLARLIKYNEYALINLVINENFFNFPLLIYDDIESKSQINSVLGFVNNPKGKKFITFIKGENNEIKKIRLNTNSLKNISQIKVKLKRQKTNINPNVFMEYFKQRIEEPQENKKKMNNLNLKNAFKLNIKNEDLKSKIEPYIISSKQLLDLFNLKYLNKNDEELNNCSTEEYINRININSIPEEKIKQIEENNKNIDGEKGNTKEDDDEKKSSNESDRSIESFLEMKIYTYTKVISLGKGNLFGELALRNSQAVRTATIITSTLCHFSYLNKTTFNNCLKQTAEIHLKQQLSFFINLPIFIDIPITSFYKKYYTNISKYYIIKNNFIFKQGEKPTRICLLNKGLYILLTNRNLSDLADLIFFLLKKIKKYINNNSLLDSNIYKDIQDSLIKNIGEENKILIDNIAFRNFYYSETQIKITEIDCPDVIGYDELIGEDGLYAFSIQAKTIENIIYTMDYKFYTDLSNKNSSVKNHHEDLMGVKLDLIIKRLIKIRNNEISSFFNHKTETDINSIINKELENEKTSCTKLKRFLQFKSTKCKFYNKNEDSSIIKDIFNEKDYFRDRTNYFQDKKKKAKERNSLFLAYNNFFLKNYINREKSYKKLILPKTELPKKKEKKYLFELDLDNTNKKEEKINKTSIKKELTDEIKKNMHKEKSINNMEVDSINYKKDIHKIINFLPIYNLRERLKTEYSKVNNNRKNYFENSKEIKGRKVNDSIRCYFEKKLKTSDSIILKIYKKKNKKNKYENSQVSNAISKEKDILELVSSDKDNKNSERDNSINNNEILDKYLYYYKGNKRFSTPKHLKLNILLLNNKSINFTNKKSLIHKSLKLLTQKNSQIIQKLKSAKKEKEIILKKSRNIKKTNNNIKRKDKESYMFQRETSYKKNLTRMKFFYGLGKK